MIDSIADTAHRALRIAGLGWALITAMTILTAPAAAQDVDKALEARMEKEKAERRGCKVTICDTESAPYFFFT